VAAIGRELNPAWPFAAGRPGNSACWSWTNDGLAALKQRRKVTLTKPVTAAGTESASRGRNRVRRGVVLTGCANLRKQLADERNVPAYIVFLRRGAAGRWPGIIRRASANLRASPAWVKKKLREFGDAFLAEIAAHVGNNPRQILPMISFAAPPGRR